MFNTLTSSTFVFMVAFSLVQLSCQGPAGRPVIGVALWCVFGWLVDWFWGPGACWHIPCLEWQWATDGGMCVSVRGWVSGGFIQGHPERRHGAGRDGT